MVRMNIQFHRFYHIFRFEDSVQVFFGKDVMFKDKFINSLSCFQRFFGYFAAKAATFDSIAATVSDNWSDYPQTLLYKGSNKSETVNYIKGYDYDYTNNVVKSFTNPFESFDVTTGAFKMKSGYTQYGAQR